MRVQDPKALTIQQTEIVQQLRDFYEAEGRRPLKQELRDPVGCVDLLLPYWETIERAFGDVDVALRLAGVPVYKPTQEDLVQAIRRFYDLNGHRPTIANVICGEVEYSRSVFLGRRGFAYWSEALEAAGFTEVSSSYSKQPSRERMVADLREFTRKLGHLPTLTEVEAEPSLASAYYYKKVLGSTWPAVLEAAQLQEVLQQEKRRRDRRRSQQDQRERA